MNTKAITPAAPQPKLPVLLIPGLDDTGTRMRHMQHALEQAGWTSVQALTLVPNDGSLSIKGMAAQVAHAAHALRAANGSAAIDMVGFSMGGVVARFMIQRLEGHRFVRRFVSLAAPHHGTLTAHLRHGEGIRQMQPASAVLRDLNNASWGATRAWSYWTPFDLMIVPAGSSALPGAINGTIPVLLHPFMTSDRRVMDVIVQALALETAA